jgi:hypothetical protein
MRARRALALALLFLLPPNARAQGEREQMKSTFAPADPATGAVAGEMRRAWGAKLGEPLRLSGVPISVRSRFSLATGTLDARGVVELEVAKGRRYRIMLRLENRAAKIVGAGGVWQKRLVLFGPRGLSEPLSVPRDGLAVVRLDALRHPDVNGLLQMEDGWDFADRVLGVRPRKVHVNMGARRDDAGEKGKVAVTLCARLLEDAPLPPGRGPGSLVGHRDGALVWGLANVVGTLWSTWDITLNGDSRYSRSAPTHEYGHFLMCDLVFRADPGALVSYYGEYMRSVISDHGRGEASIVGEAIADFFASQVSGGLSYLSPDERSGVLVGRYFYCDAASSGAPACLEDNVGGRTQAVSFGHRHEVSPTKQAMTTVGTLLTDIFDGRARRGDVPNNGSAWAFGPTFPARATPARGPDRGDERVALPGASYARIFERLTEESLHLERAPFYRALARTMLERGYGREDVCEVFALHAPNDECRAFVDLDALEGAAPLAPLGLVVALEPPLRPYTAGTASLVWNDASRDADAFEVSVLDGKRRVASARLPYARRVVWTSPALPFDRPLAFEVRTRSGSELGPRARVWAWTPAQPVRHVSARAASATTIEVRWAPVAATRYLVRALDVRTGAVSETITDTTTIEVEVPGDGAYVFDVISLNGLGERTRFPSRKARIVLVDPL